MEKSADAFRTISEVAEDLALPQHVLRFWETRFPQIRPLKRAGGRRYYRPADVGLLRTIRELLYDDGYTIKGVQRLLKEQGIKGLGAAAPIAAPVREAGRTLSGPDEHVDQETETPALASAHESSADVAAFADGPARDLVEAALATLEECRRILETALRPAG